MSVSFDPNNLDKASMIINQVAPSKAPKVGRSKKCRGGPKHTYSDVDIKDVDQEPTSTAQNILQTGKWELPKATKRRQAKQALKKRKSPFELWYDTHTERFGCQELKSCPQCPADKKHYDEKTALKKHFDGKHKFCPGCGVDACGISVRGTFVGKAPWCKVHQGWEMLLAISAEEFAW